MAKVMFTAAVSCLGISEQQNLLEVCGFHQQPPIFPLWTLLINTRVRPIGVCVPDLTSLGGTPTSAASDMEVTCPKASALKASVKRQPWGPTGRTQPDRGPPATPPVRLGLPSHSDPLMCPSQFSSGYVDLVAHPPCIY